MFFQYQKDVAQEMLTKGYHDAILSMIQGELGGPVPEYKSDDASAYIAEHLNKRLHLGQRQISMQSAQIIRTSLVLRMIVPHLGHIHRRVLLFALGGFGAPV